MLSAQSMFSWHLISNILDQLAFPGFDWSQFAFDPIIQIGWERICSLHLIPVYLPDYWLHSRDTQFGPQMSLMYCYHSSRSLASLILETGAEEASPGHLWSVWALCLQINFVNNLTIAFKTSKTPSKCFTWHWLIWKTNLKHIWLIRN